MPRFIFFFVVRVCVLVVFVELRLLVKLFIIKDFVVFVVVAWIGIHGVACAENYSAAGLAAAAGAAGAAGAAPGCDG